MNHDLQERGPWRGDLIVFDDDPVRRGPWRSANEYLDVTTAALQGEFRKLPAKRVSKAAGGTEKVERAAHCPTG